MFSLRDLRFVLCSRDLDVLRAQRIMGFFMLITHKSTRSPSHIRQCSSSVTSLVCCYSLSGDTNFLKKEGVVVFAMGIGTNVNAANLQDLATSAHNVHQLSAKTPPGSLTGDIAKAMCSSMSYIT